MTLIYKIYDNTNGKSYVGSTNQKLHRRMRTHLEFNCSSKEIICNNNYIVSVIEECDEKIRNEREQYWIDNTPNIVNLKNVIHNSKEYKKRYNLEHKEEKRLYDKKRREWINSWGGKLDRDNNNLLRINPSIFS